MIHIVLVRKQKTKLLFQKLLGTRLNKYICTFNYKTKKFILFSFLFKRIVYTNIELFNRIFNVIICCH